MALVAGTAWAEESASSPRSSHLGRVQLPYVEAVSAGEFIVTTDRPVGPEGKVWVAFQINAVTLNDQPTGRVDIQVHAVGGDASRAETLSFERARMSPGVVTQGTVQALKTRLGSSEAAPWQSLVEGVFGKQAFDTLLGRLDVAEAHKRMVQLREYEVRPGERLQIALSVGKPVGIVPMTVIVQVGDAPVPATTFTPAASGHYTFAAGTPSARSSFPAWVLGLLLAATLWLVLRRFKPPR